MSKDLALTNTMWDIHTNTDIIPLEFTEEIKPDMYGLEAKQANEINRGLEVAISERQVLIDAYSDVIKLEITAENLKTFKDLRLKLVKIRTKGLDVWKKNEKAVSIAKNNYVDAIYKSHIDINEAMENKLMEAEKFFENEQKEIAKEINDARLERLQPYVADTKGLDFAQMNDYDFDDYVAGKKARFEKEASELIAENERVENERLQTIENNRRQLAIAPYLQFANNVVEISEISLKDFETLLKNCQNSKTEYDKKQAEIAKENVKLKADAEAKEKEIAKEKLDAKTIQDAKDLKIENESKLAKIKSDAIAKQLQEKIDAENLIIANAKLNAEVLAKASVDKQLTAWIDSFEIGLPLHLKGNKTANDILSKFWAFKIWSRKQI